VKRKGDVCFCDLTLDKVVTMKTKFSSFFLFLYEVLCGLRGVLI